MKVRPVGYKYRLVSTLDHVVIGGGGHYTSNCYRPVRPSPNDAEAGEVMKWYSFNDLIVKEIINAEHVVTRDAYGFFFELVED